MGEIKTLFKGNCKGNCTVIVALVIMEVWRQGVYVLADIS